MTVNLILCSRWRAPEYECGKISEKVDVYSYGLVLFEVVSGRRVSWGYRGVPSYLDQVSLFASTSMMCFQRH